MASEQGEGTSNENQTTGRAAGVGNTDPENPAHDDEVPSVQHTDGGRMKIVKLLGCVIIILVSLPLLYVFVMGTIAVIVPLLLATFVVVRLIQLCAEGELYLKMYWVKMILRYWMAGVSLLLLVEVGILYPFAANIPKLKLLLIIGLPITNWIKVVVISAGIFLLNDIIWVFILLIVILKAKIDNRRTLWIVMDGVPEIIGCALLWWEVAVVVDRVPAFKQSKLYGLPTHKYIEVLIVILVAYNITKLLTHLFVLLIDKVYQRNLSIIICLSKCIAGKWVFNRRYAVYVVKGVESCVVFILSSVMLLLAWVFYFRYHQHIRSFQNKGTYQFGVLTLATVLVCSFLWFIKRCIVLYWMVYSVYDRLHTDIVDTGKQFYFLVLLSYIHFQNFDTLAAFAPTRRKHCWGYGLSKRKRARNWLISANIGSEATIIDLQKTIELFREAEYALFKSNISTDLRHLQPDALTGDSTNLMARLDSIVNVEGAYTEDWDMLTKMLSIPPAGVSLEIVQTWMEKAHERCRFVVNTLISEEEVVEYLDKVLSGVIIALTFIMWLLITGLATLNVLILIFSPLLALTFIFGDTCKNLFQGVVFIYFVHPFHVGDLCLIDGELLEVKRIGVWSTIFTTICTINTEEEVRYPNTELASKKITNYKTVFDWNDYIEFTFSRGVETASTLKTQIESHLEQEQFSPKFNRVEFVEIGESDKISVHFRYNVQSKGWTYFECLKEKQKLRFQFAVYIRDLLEQQTADHSQHQKPSLKKGGIFKSQESSSEDAFQSSHKAKRSDSKGWKKKNDNGGNYNKQMSQSKGKFPPCGICGKNNHEEKNCYSKGRLQCHYCKRYGHIEKNCNKKQLESKVQARYTSANNEHLFYVGQASTSNNESRWLIDSGCTNHMTNDSRIFCKLDTSIQTPVRLGNGQVVTSKGKGTIIVPTKKGTKFINDVLLVPDLVENLLSVAQMIKNGYSPVFENNHCTIYDPGNKEIAKIGMENKSFFLKWRYNEESLNRAHSSDTMLELWVHNTKYFRCQNSNKQ